MIEYQPIGVEGSFHQWSGSPGFDLMSIHTKD